MGGVDLIKAMLPSVPDERFDEIIVKGVLHLDDSQISTVSFIFWLCFMAEIHLNEIIQESCGVVLSKDKSSENRKFFNDILNQVILEIYGGKNIDIEKLEYFSEKIKIARIFLGDIEWVKVLWVLNGLRNDISHNRINKLCYKNKQLESREVKEGILCDYVRAHQGPFDYSSSPVWKKINQV